MVIYKSSRKCHCKSPSHCDHRHHHKDKKEHKKPPPKKSCQESLNEFIASVAEVENSLAQAINAEVHLMKKLDFSPKEAIKFTEKLENIIKLAIKKEIIMEFLLEETIKACKDHKKKCKKCPPHKCTCHCE
ncbi:hypothetical protein [Oceanobacillus saliphilus]|uniref:hypothetical protein n=1 Tax=Oceanobacillus saliphilus TaxID=2925834 RepID=UPI00201D56DB|nr:hypothetical protein [Oceanobacillus saliphilus]